MALGVIGTLSFAGLTAAAHGPASEGLGDLGKPMPALIQASMAGSSTDAIITGSVNTLADTASFSGPNRAGKSDRHRPTPSAMAIAMSFERARMRIAELRAGPAHPAPGQSQLADADPIILSHGEDQPRISIAGLDSALDSDALRAISGLAPEGSVTPIPMQASEQLAYARANAPATGAYAAGAVMTADAKQLWCLSTAIYFEARGESYRGQVAVAQVVLNRVKDHRYPNTICGVVYQNQTRRNSCQFSFACDGIPERIDDQKSWAQAEEIAGKVTSGELYLTEVADATHYHASYVRPAWAPRMTKVTQIGLHIFYKFKRGWLFG
ncbi:cell wall hydrolase [Devosia sp. UYZn731]|uniref:cell wall hydrolase n=1 Tax=Devosia sp. UYZn731 TaxID=3156345 RepID=UPI00339AB610